MTCTVLPLNRLCSQSCAFESPPTLTQPRAGLLCGIPLGVGAPKLMTVTLCSYLIEGFHLTRLRRVSLHVDVIVQHYAHRLPISKSQNFYPIVLGVSDLTSKGDLKYARAISK